MDTKVCSKCGEEKPATAEYWYKQPRNKDGLQGNCRECQKASAAARQKANPEKAAARVAAWRKSNPEKAAEAAAYTAAWAKANPEKMAARKAAWAKANPEKMAASTAAWRKDNPDARRVYRHRRRALKRDAGGTHTAADVAVILRNQNGKCWWCGKILKGAYHVDHRISLARGGSNSPENLVGSCPTCNMRKHAKTPEQFAGRLF